MLWVVPTLVLAWLVGACSVFAPIFLRLRSLASSSRTGRLRAGLLRTPDPVRDRRCIASAFGERVSAKSAGPAAGSGDAHRSGNRDAPGWPDVDIADFRDGTYAARWRNEEELEQRPLGAFDEGPISVPAG